MDLLGYYVTMGQIKKAKEVAKHMPDKELVEKLNYEDADSHEETYRRLRIRCSQYVQEY